MHLLKYFIFGFIFFMLAKQAHAQVTVKGTVQDSLRQPIPSVNVYVTSPDSTSIKAFDYTDTEGQFTLSLKLHHPYLLNVTSLGYEKLIIPIPAFSIPDTLVKAIVLHPQIQNLPELIVKGKKSAIITKNDTIIFNASSFERGNESTVEDLLKQLPGVTVDDNGQIKVNGKTVTKVMIDNDDLFGFNYQLLTKNLTVNAIESVSVYKHYHENEALKGISESHKTVLNLSLKESFKVAFFGTVKAHSDLDNHYRADGNLISITKKLKGYLFENANNVGYNPVGNIYSLLQTQSGFPFQSSTTLGSDAGSSSFISTAPQQVSHLGRQRYLDNQASFHALGAIYSPAKKLKIKGVGYFLPSNRQINQSSITRYDPILGLQNLTEQEQTGKHIRAGLGQVIAKYTVSSETNIKYTGKFNTFPENNYTKRLFNDNPLDTHLQSRDQTWNQHIEFTHKVAPKKAYRIRARYINEAIHQYFKINPVLSGGPFIGDSTSTLLQHSNGKSSYVGTDFKYWSKKPNHLFSVRAGAERTGDKLGNRIAVQPDYNSGHFWTRYRAFTSLTYRQTFSNNLKGHVRLTGNYVQNSTNVQADIDDAMLYASPELGLKYTFGQRQELQTQYAFNQSLPDFKQLYNGQRLTSYRSINDGAAQFSLLPSNVFTALYQYGNWEDNFVLNASFNYIFSSKSYTTATTITPTYDYSAYRLTRNLHSLSTGLGLNEFVNFLQSNLKFQYKFSQDTFTSYFNATNNDLLTQNHFFELSARTAFVGGFNASGGVDYAFSSSRNRTDNSLRRNHYVSGFIKLFLKLGKKFSATLENRYYNIHQAGSYNFADAELQYKLIKDKLTLFLDATNLLDENAFRTIYLGDYSKYQQQHVLNRRYVLIGAKINFR